MTTHRLTLVGESYAGTYIPSVARGIHRNNVANAPNIDGSERVRVPLSGIAIGNGKIDAITQSRSIPDWAYWHGLIDAGTRDYYAAEFDRCVRNLLGSPGASHYGPSVEPAPFHSFTLRSDCGIFDSMIEAAGSGALGGTTLDSGPNIYDYSTWDAYEAGDGAGGTVSKFFNHPGVQEALNVPHHRRGGGRETPEEDTFGRGASPRSMRIGSATARTRSVRRISWTATVRGTSRPTSPISSTRHT
jgi:hypothetical protein